MIVENLKHCLGVVDRRARDTSYDRVMASPAGKE